MSDIQLKSGQFSELKFGVDQSDLDNLANEFNTKLNQTNSQIDSKLLEAAQELETVRGNILETIEEAQKQNAAELQDVTNNILSNIEQANEQIKSEFEAAISESEEKSLENASSYIDKIAGGLQSQIDGEVNSWFFEGEPTLTNKPVVDWDENDYIKHVGDTYTDISTYVNDETTPTAGQSWRWCEGNTDGETTGYHWHKIADSDAVKALAEAGKAMATADGKSTIFYSTPKNYQTGDMWILQDSYSITYDDGEKTFIKGTILNANKDSESFVATDWTENVRYTDDTAAQTAIENAELADQKASEAQKTASVAKNQLDEIDNDSIIAITEFATLETQMEQIEAEYLENIKEASKYEVDSEEYTTAYEKAITTLKYHCGKVYDEQESKAPRVEYEVNGEKIFGGIEIVFEGDYGYNNIAAYYNVRQSILESISNAADTVVKAYADEVAEAKMGEIKADLDEAKADVAEANRVAQEAKDQLTEWAQDGVISPLEIQGIKDEKVRIAADYNEINADYEKYDYEISEVSKTHEIINLITFNEHYTNYNSLLQYFIDNVKDTPVEMVTDEYNFIDTQSDYYETRTKAYEAIALAVELAANNYALLQAQNEADAVKTKIDNDLITVNSRLTTAEDVANNAKNQLESWSDDNAITHFEVKGIKDEQARILADYTEIHKNYTDYSMNSENDTKLLGEFDLIYGAYNDILIKYSQATASKPVEIEPEDNFDGKQKDYYDKRIVVYEAIAAKVKDMAAAEADRKAKAEAKAVKDAIDIDLNDAKADIVEANRIAQKAKDQLTDWASDSVISPLEIQGIKDEKVRIAADYDEIEDDYNKYADEMAIVADQYKTISFDEFNGYYNAYDNQLKHYIEKVAETKAPVEIITGDNGLAATQTNYYIYRTKAYEAIAYAVELAANNFAAEEAAKKAKAEAEAVKTEIDNDLITVNSRLTTAESDAKNAKDKLGEWASDSVISPLEVQGIKDEKSRIDADKSEIDTECAQYSITDSDEYNSYSTAYSTYAGKLNSIISAVTPEKSTAIPDGFADSQLAYYNCRTAIYNKLSVTVQTTANNYALLQAQTEAQKVQTAVQADITEAKQSAQDVNTALTEATNLLSKSLSDGYLSREEKDSLKTVQSQLTSQYNQFGKEYTDVYNSKYLDGTEKTNLDTAKSNLKTAYETFNTALTNLLNTTIAAGVTKVKLNNWSYSSNFETPKNNFYDKLTLCSEALVKATSKINSNIELESKRYTDSIEIGGTNLLRYTNQSNYLSKFTGYCGTLSLSNGWIKVTQNSGQLTVGVVTSKDSKNDLLIKGKEYVLSFDSYLDNSASVSTLYLDYNYLMFNSGSNYIIGRSATITKTPARYSIKFTYTGENTSTFGAIVGSNNANCPVYYVKNIKLEQGNKATAWTPAPEDVNEAIEETNSYISGIESNLQDQIDGVVDSWFMEGQPTLNNKPVTDWKAEAGNDATKLNNIYQRHVGDTYTNINSAEDDNTGGQSWRWCPGTGEGDPANTGYHWHKIADSDATKALLEASKAQDAADKKRQVFTSQPTPPYDKGDLWVDSSNGNKTMVCITDAKKDGGSYQFADWSDITNADAVKAKNDAAAAQGTANEAKNAAATAQSAAEAAQSAAEAQEYMTAVLEKGSTDIKGGLVLTNVLALKNANDKVTAGMSGIDDDNILLWGGGTYEDAVTAKNNTTNYKKQDGTPITTLLKKDGTGKIGVFRIESSKASIYDGDGKERVLITTDSLGDYIEGFFDAADDDIRTLELSRTYSSSSSPVPSITRNSLSTSSFKYTTYVLADTLYLPTGGTSGDYVLRGNLNISGRISLTTIDASFNPDYYDPEKKVNVEVALTIANTKDSYDKGLVVKMYSRELSIKGSNGGEKFVYFDFNRDLNNLLRVNSSASYNVRLSISITPINCSFDVTTYNGSSNKTTLINSAQRITVNGKIYFTNDKNSQTAVARDGLSIISNPYNYFMVDSTSPKFQKIFINGIPGQTNTIDVASQVEDNQLYMDCYKTNESTDPTYRFMENLYNFVSAAYSGLHLLLSKADGLEMDSRLTKMYLTDLDRAIHPIEQSLKEVNILCLKDTGDFNMLNDDI